MESTLLVVTRTSMLKPRYGVQDWVCMVGSCRIRRAVCETNRELTPHSGKGLRTK